MSNFGVMFYKTVIEVAKTKKRLKVFEFLWDRPMGDARNFGRVHFNVSFRDDDTKVFNGGFIKEAFFGFEVEIVFGKARKNIMGKCMKSC